MAHVRRPNPIHRGMTLIELMVVISIVAVLSVYALRMLPSMAEGHRVREAARSLSVYFNLAKNRAVETGRPCGVILRRMENEPGAAMVMCQAEVPPAYSGDSRETKAILRYEQGNPVIRTQVIGSFNFMLVHGGDLIQFNNQGHWYTILGPDDNNDGVLDNASMYLKADIPHDMIPWPDGDVTAPMPFRIVRRPKQSIAAPLQLSRGMIVDLTASGNNTVPQLFFSGGTTNSSVIIMFSPNGSLDRCYWNDPTTGAPTCGTPTEPLFFLTGRREQIGVGPGDPSLGDDSLLANWQNLKNLWVSVSPQTGLVTVTENYYPEKYYTNPGIVGVPGGIREARQYAKEAQTMGGR